MSKAHKTYIGYFNYRGELFTLYTEAKGEEKAFSSFMFQLKKKLHLSRYSICQYFSGGKDNFLIVEDISEKS